MVNKLKTQIKAYDKMIEELVNVRTPDRIIGRIELKRQDLEKKLEMEVLKEIITTVSKLFPVNGEDKTREDHYLKVNTLKEIFADEKPSRDKFINYVNKTFKEQL